MKTADVVFVINLLQDINIIRPLAYMAARDLERRTLFLVSGAFRKRDKSGIWQQELAEIARDTQGEIADFGHEFEALRALRDKTGVLIAASESHLNAHKPVHDLFRVAPSRFLKVTLQHGFECVGFLQSRDQNLAHGSHITFAADIICGWCEAERLTSIAPSQRHKLYVAGPPAVLQIPMAGKSTERQRPGLVCENMHSPRLNVAGNFKVSFLDIFAKYCTALGADGQKVALRPHPGGQYTLKNNVPLPGNVVINNAPIYKVDLSRYAYGISAPSSILIDMVLAGIPVAVWQDEGSVMDLGNYEGLTRIGSLNDWLDFSREAVAHPERFLEAQQRFIEQQRMQTVPESVFRRYAALLNASVAPATPECHPGSQQERVLYVANAYIPTLQLSFIKPLAPLVEAGTHVSELITEEQISQQFGKHPEEEAVRSWLRRRFVDFGPTIVVFCRYSGPQAVWLRRLADEYGAPAIYHIDDDLLHIPEDIGLKKHQYHNQPERLEAVRYLLDNATLVYCSTSRLKARLGELGVNAPLIAGNIYCSGQVMEKAECRPIKKIGYMGIGHEKNLSSVLGALIRFLKIYGDVDFEFFGTIPVPKEFEQFGDRIKRAPKIDHYEEFLWRFADYKWDIGICPLTPIAFNMMKANTKWVEYTSVGAAVVASKGTVYDECCADGCGILADTEDEWFAALDGLARDPEARFQQVRRAQDKLADVYSTERLRGQVLGIFAQAHELFVESKLKEHTQ